MNDEAKAFYARKFFPHLLPIYGILCVESILRNRRPILLIVKPK